MEETSTENAKISDSGYSNTCSNSRSQRSSGSSISRNSNRSESSGYCGRRPSTFDSSCMSHCVHERSNEALPQPISKRKDKEYKKKKLKTSLAVNAEAEITLRNNAGAPPESASYNLLAPVKSVLEKKTAYRKDLPLQSVTIAFLDVIQQEEVATVELVDATDPGEHNGGITDSKTGLTSRTNLLDNSSSQANDGFCAVISMHDGFVLYTTPSICTALGYPKDAWIGSSFIDYVHPKDRTTLADQITSGIASSPDDDRSKGINGRRTSLFCGLRKNVKSENHQANELSPNTRSNVYLPFHLTLTFRDLRNRAMEQQPRAIFLVVTAQPVHSAYKGPEETIISSIFTTRHTATCHLSHVDPDVVQYFGYLPQDMIGRSLFDFYHPEDLPFIKDIYETVIRLEGSSFRSKPYRFAAQNGSYVVLESEWSSFVNPWTKKLEFVIGQHRILKGPPDPDIFRVHQENECSKLANISEEVLKESKIIQNEIRALLDENIQRRCDITEHDVSKRCKDLASFMESLLQEMRAPAPGRGGTFATDDRSFSGSRNPLLQEHDSVMFGEISPHHEYYDSKSSTGTPLSYNQLNYNENIERFFKSKPPVATMYGSDEENMNSSNDEGSKTSPTSAARKYMSPINGSGASGSGSAENLSNGSNNLMNSANRDTSNSASNITIETQGFKAPTLTESLLHRHNENMEKMMMQKHRELRSSIKNSDKLKDSRIKPVAEKMSVDQNNHYVNHNHGVKRSGSHSWEGDSFKVSKHDEVSRTSNANQFPTNVANTTVPNTSVDQSNANINLWSPLSVTVPSAIPAPPCISSQYATYSAVPRIPLIPQMIPVYYVPVPQATEVASPNKCALANSTATSAVPMSQQPYISYVATTMAGVVYPPMMGATPPGTTMYRPFLMPEQALAGRENCCTAANNTPDRKCPANQATSIKAEPGSIMATSESSKKLLSPGELFSSCVSNDGGCSSVINASTPTNPKTHKQIDDNRDESSSSSFYSSLLYKSSECSCNPDQKTVEPLLDSMSAQEVPTKSSQGMCKKDPPWLEGVQLTPELIYEYQIHPKALNEVLKADMDTLKNINQPLLVNEQLGQLYFDMELEGFGTKLMLEDGITSSGSDSGSSSGSCSGPMSQQHKQRRRMVKYGRLMMIHEENAPLPPPLTFQTVSCQQS